MTKFFSITEFLKEIINDTIFESRVYHVGGSVRDMIMKRTIKDIDLVIDM